MQIAERTARSVHCLKIVFSFEGAHLTNGGCYFKAWAPNAKEVHVIGEFNNWTKGDNKLANRGNGYWDGIVQNASTGHKYKYLIIGHDNKEHYKIDLVARDTLHSGLDGLDKPTRG